MVLLSWIGRQRARAIAALVLISILTPSLGVFMKSYLTPAVIGLLCISFLRIDVSAFRSYVRRPKIVIAASVWTTFVIPVLFVFCSWGIGIDDSSPGLYTGIMLHAVASPMMAAPAFAALMGLDATLVLITMIVSTALVPLSAPFFAMIFLIDISLTPLMLGLKLLAILAGSAVVGLLLRHIMGPEKVLKLRDEIDGVNIIVMFVFISAALADIGITFLKHPLMIIGLTALAFVIFAVLLGITYAVFSRLGSKCAISIALMTSLRNMGLMIAATSGAVPEISWLYFAVGQFPICLTPLILQPLVGFLNRKNAGSLRE